MKNKNLWTALITPMHNDGSVHFEDLERIVRIQEKAGNGILILGSTGEGLALDSDEKIAIAEFVSEMKLSVPIMAGVGGFNLASQKEWIEHCNRLNVDAFLLVTPLYSKPGFHGQTEWFGKLLDASEKPCMIYNIPSRTGVKLQPAVLQEIEDHPNFWSVKEASGNISEYQEFREKVPSIPLFSGDDALLPFFTVAGCNGLVSVASNIWPEETGLYVEKCLLGETKNLFPLWKNAVKALFSAPNPVPAKVLMKSKGIISTATLRSPLLEKELSSAKQLLEIDEAINNWYKNNR